MIEDAHLLGVFVLGSLDPLAGRLTSFSFLGALSVLGLKDHLFLLLARLLKVDLIRVLGHLTEVFHKHFKLVLISPLDDQSFLKTIRAISLDLILLSSIFLAPLSRFILGLLKLRRRGLGGLGRLGVFVSAIGKSEEKSLSSFDVLDVFTRTTGFFRGGGGGWFGELASDARHEPGLGSCGLGGLAVWLRVGLGRSIRRSSERRGRRRQSN